MARKAGNRAATCSICGRPPRDGERISARNKCIDCAEERMRTHDYSSTGVEGDWKAKRDAGLREWAQRLLADA